MKPGNSVFIQKKLADYLTERGFSLIVDVSSLEYRAKYMGSSGRHMKGFQFYRAALATVNEASFSK